VSGFSIIPQFKIFSGVKDVYTFFIEHSLSLLAKNGNHSFIVPSAWLGGPEYKKLRELLLPYQIKSIILLPFNVFKDAYVDTTVFVISNQMVSSTHKVKTHVYPKRERLLTLDLTKEQYKAVHQDYWMNIEDKKFVLDPGTVHLLENIRKETSATFADAIEIKRGVLFDKNLLTVTNTGPKSYSYFEGDVYRYQINLVADHWIEFDDKMKERPKDFIWFEGPRILLRRLVNRRQRMMASLATDTFITNKNLYSLLPKDKSLNIAAILGVLNSRLISYLYINQVTQATKDDFPQVTIKDVLALPFPPLAKDKAIHDKIVVMAEQMLLLNKQLVAARTDHEKTSLQRQIDATDKQIDKLVYELYGLTEEEIRIVDGN
jgi:adenine-specific DNA-methyltransferase